MKTFMKVIKIILICLAIALGIAFTVLYIVNPDQAKSILDSVIDYVNRPLPVAGVSIGLFGSIILKILSTTTYGRKNVADAKAQYEEDSSKAKAEYELYKTELKETVSGMKEVILKICETSPNKKIKEIGVSYEEECKEVVTEHGEE